MNKNSLGDFKVMSPHVRAALSASTVIPNPFAGCERLDVYASTVRDGRLVLPSRYHSVYIDVLDQAVKQAEASLKALSPRATARRKALFKQLETVFTALASPIVQLKSSACKEELKAFLALASNVYRRFHDDEQVKKAAQLKILWPDLDPLGYFSPSYTSPTAIPASQELPVTLIAKPLAQMKVLPLWLTDGHEVGGHAIHSAVDGFENDMKTALEEAIRDAFRRQCIKTSKSTVQLTTRSRLAFLGGNKELSVEELFVKVFTSGVNELSADAAGLINLGPMFINAGLLLLNASRNGNTLTAASEFDSTDGFAEHPADVVRVLLGIEMIRRLPIKGAAVWSASLLARLEECCGGSLPDSAEWFNSSGRRVIELPLADLRAALPVVAEALLTSRLKALSGQCLTDIMTWEQSDEDLSHDAASLLAQGRTDLSEDAEARHVAAGALIALESASRQSGFRLNSATIQKAGMKVLTGLYESQCLFCQVPRRAAASTPTAAQYSLTDLVRFVRGLKAKHSDR